MTNHYWNAWTKNPINYLNEPMDDKRECMWQIRRTMRGSFVVERLTSADGQELLRNPEPEFSTDDNTELCYFLNYREIGMEYEAGKRS